MRRDNGRLEQGISLKINVLLMEDKMAARVFGRARNYG